MSTHDASCRTTLQSLTERRPGRFHDPRQAGAGGEDRTPVGTAAPAPGRRTGDGLPELLDHARDALERGDLDGALALLTDASRLAASRPPAAQPRQPDPREGTPPSPAERRVLVLLAEDLTLAAIADRLVLSRNTVKSHVRLLYRRLGVGTRAEAVATARERGLL